MGVKPQKGVMEVMLEELLEQQEGTEAEGMKLKGYQGRVDYHWAAIMGKL